MTYNSASDIRSHIETVYRLMLQCTSDLLGRVRIHDASKLKSPEKELFDKYTPLLKDTTYGSDEYKQYLKEMGVALQHHYENNSHHPEFHYRGIDGMTLIDIIEMFCDWKAASLRHDDGDFLTSLKHNRKRFNIGSQLHSIFLNTANELFPT